MFSRPTEKRTIPASIPAATSCSSESCRCVSLAGCRTQVRISATCTSLEASFNESMNFAAAGRPPLMIKEMTPQDLPPRYFSASAWFGSEGSAGQLTLITASLFSRYYATAIAFSVYCFIRTGSVSNPRFNRNAECAAGYTPKSRMSCILALMIYAMLP